MAAEPARDRQVYFAIYQSSGQWGFWLHRASPAGELGWALTEADFVFEPTKNVRSTRQHLTRTRRVSAHACARA
ncbi:hypothetical protein DB30_02252 [Enhygromyxa salina]|uniref:Uncharacterized protein n=1 Tax=Enhygromyxa salina TaxID=215803 RepID=A0A0C2CL36_9BACT|nr:hypothetical protein DB30_02252 [Enhygromyxa salina]